MVGRWVGGVDTAAGGRRGQEGGEDMRGRGQEGGGDRRGEGTGGGRGQEGGGGGVGGVSDGAVTRRT